MSISALDHGNYVQIQSILRRGATKRLRCIKKCNLVEIKECIDRSSCKRTGAVFGSFDYFLSNFSHLAHVATAKDNPSSASEQQEHFIVIQMELGWGFAIYLLVFLLKKLKLELFLAFRPFFCRNSVDYFTKNTWKKPQFGRFKGIHSFTRYVFIAVGIFCVRFREKLWYQDVSDGILKTIFCQSWKCYPKNKVQNSPISTKKLTT